MLIYLIHLRSTLKRERFFAHGYFSNETVSKTTVSTGPMKMFLLEHEAMNVCQRNVARFGHMFDKINDIFQGFGSLVSLRLQKDGRAKRKQIWTNLSHWNVHRRPKLPLWGFIIFFYLCANVQLVKRGIVTTVIYYQVSLSKTWLSVWRCSVWGKAVISKTF